jgi:hypothetical protein
MAVVIGYKNAKSLEDNILEIFAHCEKDELLVTDIRETLMGKYLNVPGISRWTGLTSRNIKIAPKGAIYRGDLDHIGDFIDLMEHFGYETRAQKHGAGNKYFAKI